MSSQCCKAMGLEGPKVLLHLRMMAYATAIITVSVHKFAVMVIKKGIDDDLCVSPPPPCDHPDCAEV